MDILMSTNTLITLCITWAVILVMIVYLFRKLLRKNRKKKGITK
jgi:hypothetical protein